MLTVAILSIKQLLFSEPVSFLLSARFAGFLIRRCLLKNIGRFFHLPRLCHIWTIERIPFTSQTVAHRNNTNTYHSLKYSDASEYFSSILDRPLLLRLVYSLELPLRFIVSLDYRVAVSMISIFCSIDSTSWNIRRRRLPTSAGLQIYAKTSCLFGLFSPLNDHQTHRHNINNCGQRHYSEFVLAFYSM